MGNLGISPETVSADVIYLGFIFSLWIAITAAYIPGTGVIETIAVVGFVGTIAVLSALPTSWVAVFTIIIGGAIFMILPFAHVSYAPFSLGGLVLQGVGGLFLFTSDLTVSPLVLVGSLLIPAMYHHFLLIPALKEMKQSPQEDRDSLIMGQVGRVTKALNPIGTVHVNSEQWSAITETEETVEEGRKVLVIGKDNLRLIVEPMKSKHKPEEMDLINEGSN